MDIKVKQQWSAEETTCLLNLWSSVEVQNKLEGAVRTKPIFEQLKREMANAGYDRNVEQIINKIKKIKKEYRDHKKELGRSSNGRPKKHNPHFDTLDSVLGDRPACKTTGALNSATAILEAMVDDDCYSEPQSSRASELNVTTEEEAVDEETTPGDDDSPANSVEVAHPQAKRRKRNRDDEFLEYMEKSDNKFLDFHKETMKQMEADSAAFLGLMGRVVAVMESQANKNQL
ncbi:hypothetical protein ACEWY4_001311 [Coilia grayii]|uniref:Myb/SANT-like DNA-binding domain-containing protein n=1 Tax=Coilia grayii TaxID=363190 RepID=A0ABD1KSN7_9TELE